jgi:adhesin transport system membrane fusion protein
MSKAKTQTTKKQKTAKKSKPVVSLKEKQATTSPSMPKQVQNAQDYLKKMLAESREKHFGDKENLTFQDYKEATSKEVNSLFSLEGWQDGEFMDDVRQATLRGAHPAANILFWLFGLFIFIALIWMSTAEVDEVTRGEGRVIPSSQVQIIQNLEGGIVDEIMIKEGDIVEKGDVMIRIDDTGFASSLAEKKAKFDALQAEIARLEAEATGKKEIKFPEELQEKAPHIVESELARYQARQAELESSMGILKDQITQKEQELEELMKRRDQASRSYELSNEELEMTIPLEEEGVVSKVDILRLKRDVNDRLGEKEATELAVTRGQSALEEAKKRSEERVFQFKNEALTELATKKEEYARLTEVLKAVKDQVDRTTVRAPVRGTIKRVLVNTLGGVITPGMDLVELIPLEDSLLVEAKIRPSDIAFLKPNLDAVVKFSAYDFTIYGGLEAKLEHIGADTVLDEKGNAFYHIRVRTEKNNLGDDGNELPIIPGMVATVDIISGKKTVLDYMMKPLRRTREMALTER